jgi:Tol biopolymer transport system component
MGSVDTSGHYTAPDTRGGSTTVVAQFGGAQGSAKVTVTYQLTRVSTDDGSTAPADSASKFAGASNTPALAPALVYPLDGALVPSNLGELEVQWRPPASPANLFEVSLQGTTVDVRVYTNAILPNGGRINLTPAEWTAIAASAAGDTLTVAVRALNTSNTAQIGASSPAKLTVGRDAVSGGIYYWSSTGSNSSTEGINRHAFGDTTATASAFYTETDGNKLFNDGMSNHCVACHALSRDGKKIAVTFNGGDGPAAVLDVMSKTQILPLASGLFWNFASLSPDGSKMVASHGGVLKIYDLAAQPGAVLQVLSLAPHTWGTHPDWSPDGKSIVYVAPATPMADWIFTGGSIVVTTDSGNGQGFVGNTTLVASAGENNYYPTFSPDGAWILFDRSKNDSYDNADAEPWVVSADGKTGPIALAAASGMGNLTNSWPRWSPFVLPSGPKGPLYYFTFSSKRDYGIELVGLGRPQIWMAAFDPGTAASGSDPSWAPFWLPFQDPSTSNHIAQWTTAIVGVN